MQLTSVFTFVALTIAGVSAMPNGHTPPPPPPPPAPPVINHQVNYCSSGAPYCCSPSNENGKTVGTTCVLSTTQCNSVSICCNNAASDGSSAVCSAATSISNFPPTTVTTASADTITSASSSVALANTSSQTSSPSPAPRPALSNSPSSSSNQLLSLLSLLVLFV